MTPREGELFLITRAAPHDCRNGPDYRNIKAKSEIMEAHIKSLRSALEGLLAHVTPQIDVSRAKDALYELECARATLGFD